MDKNLILNFEAPSEFYTLAFEDNGRVAYAYLKKDQKIVGDVWLYNRCLAPKIPEWDNDKENTPYANIRDNISKEGTVQKRVENDDVLVNWDEEEGHPVAYIYIFENLYGVIGVNDKPGYARFAVKNSPIALVMDITE